MTDLSEHLKGVVMSSIADDYESFDVICQEVSRWAATNHIEVSREGMLRTLGGLVSEGLVETYILSTIPPYSQLAEYSAERTDDLWFYLSPKGRAEIGAGRAGADLPRSANKGNESE